MPQVDTNTKNTTTHTPAHAAVSMAITHPTLVWSQLQQQKQLKGTTPKDAVPTRPQLSASSVHSQDTSYSYRKDKPTTESKTFFQKVKAFFS